MQLSGKVFRWRWFYVDEKDVRIRLIRRDNDKSVPKSPGPGDGHGMIVGGTRYAVVAFGDGGGGFRLVIGCGNFEQVLGVSSLFGGLPGPEKQEADNEYRAKGCAPCGGNFPRQANTISFVENAYRHSF